MLSDILYPEHEREARARGIPTMGSGRIFQIPEETIKCQPFECPDHFYVINAMDFGWDHPQAQIQLWWDKDADTMYLARTWKKKEHTAVQAWGAVKPWAQKIPTAWPHDGNQHEKGGGEQLKNQYSDAGFMMLPEHATWPDGGNTGPSFQSMKEQNRAEIQELLSKTPPGTPEYQLLTLQYFMLLDGKGVEISRNYANKQLVVMGAKPPETPEEEKWLAEAQQQPKEPSADVIVAQAQDKLAIAELIKAQNQQLQIQVDAAKVESANQLNQAKIAEIFNNMDMDKQAAFRDFLNLMQKAQNESAADARANAELLLKGDSQQHSQRMDFANILQSQRQNQPSGRAAEIPQ